MFETIYHYIRKGFCSNVKRHIRKERLTLDQRLGPWHQQKRHSRNEWYRTHEWMYKVAPMPGGGETVTRFRQSTALADHFVPDATVDDVPDYAHPVTVTTSDYGTRPCQDYRCATPPAPVVHTQNVQINELATLWESSKIVAASDRSLDPWAGQAGFAWILTTPQEEAFAKDSKDIWTNPKYMSSFRAELAGLHDMLSYALKYGNKNAEYEIFCGNKVS